MLIARLAVPGWANWSAAKPASSSRSNRTSGIDRRSASTILRPLESVARSSAGNFGVRRRAGLRAAWSGRRPAGAAAYSGKGRTSSVYTPSESQRAAAPRTCAGGGAGDARAAAPCRSPAGRRTPRPCASTSDLPPNPPIRSTPRMNPARVCVLARCSSDRAWARRRAGGPAPRRSPARPWPDRRPGGRRPRW